MIGLPTVSPSWLQIGDSSSLFRICSKCGESRFYQSFPLKGGSKLYKRRRYCMDCADRLAPTIHYNFDISILNDRKYGFIRYIGQNKKWCDEITLQEAIRFVSLGKARISTPYHIVQLKDPGPFVKFILERDSNTCQRCGKHGTKVVRLQEIDVFKCFCVECASTEHPANSPQRGPEPILYTPPPLGELQVYCDGSSSDDQYGCGVVLISSSGSTTHHEQTRCAKRKHSLYAELLAISCALRSILDYLNRDGHKVTSVNVITDVRPIESFLGKQTKKLKDVYVAKEVQEINLLLGDLKKASPETLVSIRYIGSARNQLYRLSHLLSRCYKGAVPTVELVPIADPSR